MLLFKPFWYVFVKKLSCFTIFPSPNCWHQTFRIILLIYCVYIDLMGKHWWQFLLSPLGGFSEPPERLWTEGTGTFCHLRACSLQECSPSASLMIGGGGQLFKPSGWGMLKLLKCALAWWSTLFHTSSSSAGVNFDSRGWPFNYREEKTSTAALVPSTRLALHRNWEVLEGLKGQRSQIWPIVATIYCTI